MDTLNGLSGIVHCIKREITFFKVTAFYTFCFGYFSE